MKIETEYSEETQEPWADITNFPIGTAVVAKNYGTAVYLVAAWPDKFGAQFGANLKLGTYLTGPVLVREHYGAKVVLVTKE